MSQTEKIQDKPIEVEYFLGRDDRFIIVQGGRTWTDLDTFGLSLLLKNICMEALVPMLRELSKSRKRYSLKRLPPYLDVRPPFRLQKVSLPRLIVRMHVEGTTVKWEFGFQDTTLEREESRKGNVPYSEIEGKMFLLINQRIGGFFNLPIDD